MSTSRFESWLADSGIGVSVKQSPAGTRTAVDAARAVGCDVKYSCSANGATPALSQG